nr:ribonuclease H-like domain, reverse transcriptase, RNA-dependent DNA polymerase [Tanacetum cinerariifolium]
MYNNLDRLYNDCYIKVQAYQYAVKTLESQKEWYHKTQISLEETVKVLSFNLEDTTNTLSDKSSDSEAYVSCDLSPETKTKDSLTTVDVKTVPESDIEDLKSTF